MYISVLLICAIVYIHNTVAQKQVCVANRQLCISSVVNGTNVDFTLAFSTLGWVSFGLSSSGTMNNADTVLVWTQDVPGKGTAVQVSDRWSNGHSLPRADPRQDWNVINVNRTSPDNKFIVTLRRLIDTGEDVDLPFKKESQRYIWALTTSPVTISTGRPDFTVHSDRGIFDYNALETTAETAVASPNGPQTVLDTDNTSSIPRETAVFIHGLCMALAWGLFSYLGIFVARFMKRRLGVWWFIVHWGLMLLVTGLSLAAVVVMVIAIGNQWFSSVHAIVGSIVFFAMWVQIILGVVIDRMYNPKRMSVPKRDKAHWIIGYTLAIGGPVAIALGLVHENASTAVLGAFIAIWVLFLGLFAFGSHQLPKGKL